MGDDLLPRQPDPVPLDHIATPSAIEPKHRVRAVTPEEDDALVVRFPFQLGQHSPDRPEFDPAFANVTLAAITRLQELQILGRQLYARVLDEALNRPRVSGWSMRNRREQTINVLRHRLSLAASKAKPLQGSFRNTGPGEV
jgi:hypothetical protein